MSIMIEQISIDLSNYCRKGCPFCYNSSNRDGATSWKPSEVIAFAKSCIMSGVKAVSLGGGEPLEYEGVFDIIEALFPLTYLTLTTNGLPLHSSSIIDSLKCHKPDKIHISIHNADNETEYNAFLETVKALSVYGRDINVQKTDKLFKPIDGYGVIQLMDAKNLKKFHKILTKDKFAPLTAELKFLSMDNILDI